MEWRDKYHHIFPPSLLQYSCLLLVVFLGLIIQLWVLVFSHGNGKYFPYNKLMQLYVNRIQTDQHPSVHLHILSCRKHFQHLPPPIIKSSSLDVIPYYSSSSSSSITTYDIGRDLEDISPSLSLHISSVVPKLTVVTILLSWY